MMLNLEKKPVEAGIRYVTQKYPLFFRTLSAQTSEKHTGAFGKENKYGCKRIMLAITNKDINHFVILFVSISV